MAVEPDDYTEALLDYAIDFDDDNLAITEVNGEENLVGVSAETAESGSVIVWANGGFSYTAPVNFFGQDSFSVTFDDGTNTLSMTVTLNVINTYALDAGYSTLKNQTLTQVTAGGLLDFAGDVDDDTITVTKVGGSSNNVGVAFTTSEGGTATIQSTGAFVYVPPADFSGEDSAYLHHFGRRLRIDRDHQVLCRAGTRAGRQLLCDGRRGAERCGQ